MAASAAAAVWATAASRPGTHAQHAEKDDRLAGAIGAPAARHQVAGHPAAEKAARVGCDVGHPGEETDLLEAESVDLIEVERQPRDVEPPHRVAKETREHDGPGLAIAQQLEPGERGGSGGAVLLDKRSEEHTSE